MSYLMAFVSSGIVAKWEVISSLNSMSKSDFCFFKNFYGIENLRLCYIHDYCSEVEIDYSEDFLC